MKIWRNGKNQRNQKSSRTFNHGHRASKSRFLSKNPLPTLRESPGFRTAATLIPVCRCCRCCCGCCRRPVTVSVHMTAQKVAHWGQNARASVTYRFRSPSARVDSRRPLAHPPPRAAAPPHDCYRRASGSSPTPTQTGKKPSPAPTIMENRCPKSPRLVRNRLFAPRKPVFDLILPSAHVCCSCSRSRPPIQGAFAPFYLCDSRL